MLVQSAVMFIFFKVIYKILNAVQITRQLGVVGRVEVREEFGVSYVIEGRGGAFIALVFFRAL